MDADLAGAADGETGYDLDSQQNYAGEINIMLTESQISFFRDKGYLVVEKVMTEEILNRVQLPLERWVEQKISEWMQEGRLQEDFHEAPFGKRLYYAWNAAGQPRYDRSPSGAVVSPEIFDFMRFPACVSIARDLMGTNNIIAQGDFRTRPKLPNQVFTDTPWHQDAMCSPHLIGSNSIVIWIPLVDVNENNSCLEVAPGHHKDGLYRKAKAGTLDYYASMRTEDVKQLRHQPVPLKRGDVLCFNELTPHRALPNLSEAARWSVDIRFESCGLLRGTGLTRGGFICSHDDPAQIETSFENWKKIAWPNVV